MRNGKVVEQGSTDQIFHTPQAAYTKALLTAAFDLETSEEAIRDGVISE
jgi:ABC-type microcin C transport system duplicated ATPase subunit YejF